MKIQELYPYFNGTDEAKQKAIDLLGEALSNLEKTGKVLIDKGISVNGNKEVFNYAIALSQYTAIYEFTQGIDLDGDSKEKVKAAVEEKKTIEKKVASCPDNQ